MTKQLELHCCFSTTGQSIINTYASYDIASASSNRCPYEVVRTSTRRSFMDQLIFEHPALRNMHAKTDMYVRAMLLLRNKQALNVTKYAPIARALTTMDSHAEETLKRKLDVAYVLAKEGIAFNKMMPVCPLMERGRPRYWI